MITQNLRTNQISGAAYRWYLDYLDAMDRRDLPGYLVFLAPECTLRFNGHPEVGGRAAIGEMLAGYWQSFAGLEHDLLNIYGSDDAFMLEATNHYLRHDGRRVSLPAVALTDRGAGGLVTSVRLYTDTAPLFTK